MSYKGIPEWKWVGSWVEKYVDDAAATLAEQKRINSSVSENVAVVAEKTAEIVIEKITCSASGCKRKAGVECLRRMCLNCCACCPSEEICQSHYLKKKEMEEESLLLQEYLNGKASKRMNSFLHHEEKLTKVGQTVIIWCFRDFCLNPKFSEPTITMLRHQQRRKLQARNRRLSASNSSKQAVKSSRKSL